MFVFPGTFRPWWPRPSGCRRAAPIDSGNGAWRIRGA